MRIGTTAVRLAAMLTASPLALAQRASLADRVAALEARSAGEQNGTELVNQVDLAEVPFAAAAHLQDELLAAKMNYKAMIKALVLDGSDGARKRVLAALQGIQRARATSKIS